MVLIVGWCMIDIATGEDNADNVIGGRVQYVRRVETSWLWFVLESHVLMVQSVSQDTVSDYHSHVTYHIMYLKIYLFITV